MKIVIEEKQEKSVDLEMPAYYHWGSVFIKILNETTGIVVKEYDHNSCISVEDCIKSSIAMFVSEGKRITEEKFTTAFHRVGEKLKRELIKAIESDQWHEQEQNDLKSNALAEIL